MTKVAPRHGGGFRFLWLLLGAMIVFVGANVHLVYVAISSEPGCVAHLKEKNETTGQFHAAKPAC